MRSPLTAHVLTAGWAVAVAVALLWPDPTPDGMTSLPVWVTAAAHVVLFLVLAFLLAGSLRAARKPRPLATAFLLAFAYGMALEVAQISIEGRGAEWGDVVMNGLGGLGGVLAAWVSRRPSGRVPKRPV